MRSEVDYMHSLTNPLDIQQSKVQRDLHKQRNCGDNRGHTGECRAHLPLHARQLHQPFTWSINVIQFI